MHCDLLRLKLDLKQAHNIRIIDRTFVHWASAITHYVTFLSWRITL